MDKSTSAERLVRIETKLCKNAEIHSAEMAKISAQLKRVQKTLDEQAKENQRLRKFLNQWDAYQQQVRDGTIQID